MKSIYSSIITLALCCCFCPLPAQQPASYNSAEIQLALKKLNVTGAVLYIAAHPDDENTRLLSYLSKEKKLRTAYLSLTRGDGGQNLIGKEQGELLGLIRTQELLAARRVDGAEQFFTCANDFGYSKNPQETLEIWNKEKVLADVVWVIRNFKPDVIITRFPTTGEGGHGHHTASAMLAEEAFSAAADPKRFPEQLQYVQPWQAKRLFWNTFTFGSTNTTSPDQLKLDVGVYNTLLGKGYGELAAESRSMHKSQGFGSSKTRGSTIEYFKQLKGDSVKTDLFEGLNLGWSRFEGTIKFAALIAQADKLYNATEPDKSVPLLADAYRQLQQWEVNTLPTKEAAGYKQLKLKELQQLLLQCSGTWLEATAGDYIGIADNNISITTQVIKRNETVVSLRRINYLTTGYDTTFNKELKYNELTSYTKTIKLPADLPTSNPYWLNQKHDINRYTVTDQQLIGMPENKPAITINAQLDFNGLVVDYALPLVYKSTDPVDGEVYRPFEVLPPATLTFTDKSQVFTTTNTVRKIECIIKATKNNVTGEVKLQLPDGWEAENLKPNFTLNTKGEEQKLSFTIKTKPGKVQNGLLKATLLIDNQTYTKGIQRIDYKHIPAQFVLTDAEVKLVYVDLKKTTNTIGYIAGAGDDVAQCLKQIGYNVTLLTDEQLSNENLSKYDAIVTGVRAYNTNERLQVHYNRLMEYVKNGGNLIVQYNTNSRIGPVVAKIAPYPFTISRDRVTDEKAKVTLLKPQHAVLTFPNKITDADFDGWIQERGIYFASDLDKNYETILAMNDPQEKPSAGSLIVGKYGKGNFVYTGLVFFRELPAGVPGAYRLFTNLLSLPKN